MTVAEVRVTIGLPVYNGAQTLGDVLRSLLAQTYTAFRLVISDNASTDGTEQICRYFAERDDRIEYVRQPVNIGAEANFDFVLAQARSEYFMWAAADDTRSEEFIEANLRFLDEHVDYAGSTCRVRFVGGEYDGIRMGDESRNEDSAGERIARFFDVWHANGRYYSLFRRRDLVVAKGGMRGFLACDWAVVVRLLARGKLNRIDGGSVDLGVGGTSSHVHFLASQRTRWLHWFFPMFELARATWSALAGQRAASKAIVLRKIWRLNCLAARHQLNVALGRVK